jgi:hypothetical protein
MKNSNPVESFRTHSNYLRAINSIILGPTALAATNPYEGVAQQIASSGLIKESVRDSFDIVQVRTCLESAWGTEALLLMTGEVFCGEEAIRLSNNWLTIQTYYVMYHCAQALHVAQGHLRPDSHTKTQSIFHDQWVARPGFLHPWTFAYGSMGAAKMPHGVVIDPSIHSWSVCEGDNIWSLYAKALLTTRREHLLERYREERKEKRKVRRKSWKTEELGRIAQGKMPRKEPSFPLPQLTSEEKKLIDEKRVRAVTLIDYIYRLRIKTNYEDSNMFIDGPEDVYQSKAVRSAFCNIASRTLFLYETAIRAIVGKPQLLKWVDLWVERNLPRDSAHGIAGRRDII